MNEEEARAWIADRYGPAKLQRLEAFVRLLVEANEGQNLISKASESLIWSRHILDSGQLARFAPDAVTWLDIGSGPGLPGLVLAILEERQMLLVEPRRKRVEFLNEVVERLALRDVRIKQGLVERIPRECFQAVTARAFAPLAQIFESTVRLTDSSTIWVLPKGRSAERELDDARQAWQGVFHVEQSLTQDDARIVIATGVRPR